MGYRITQSEEFTALEIQWSEFGRNMSFIYLLSILGPYSLIQY